ncbi:DNA-processing protein DprA [uncultured Alistipes sp.]|jgi:DNA protecting protein DprA|uniref:DNA-processing protein DprA n=1 Tax=uncultured Alistipes sp. TaxID=538949 RepID=UPI0025E4D0DA|nr:DNA-processing protein DprA [uncultured Alistipes sp.]
MTIEDIALQMTPGIGVKGAVHLLGIFNDAHSIFAASLDDLIGRGALRTEIAEQIVRHKGFAAAEKELEYCRRHGISAIASTDPEYPVLLREIPDYPHIIYVQGNTKALSSRCISMVGTREATPYGQTMCNRLVEGLAAQVPGLCIVSGLAFGIDIAAHRAALAAGVPTVAVLANTLPGVMPSQHTAVARDMLEHGGALVTELHSHTKQNGTAYISRNRIIAALSAGCVVVESPDSGGSLVTAHCADDYNRSVMAVPGRATDRKSSGTNHLIRNRKAQLVLTANDIIRELMWDLGKDPATLRAKPATPQLTPDEAGLLGCFRTDDPLPLETLSELSGLNPGELATLLVGLELAGGVRQLPGNRYMKLTGF